MTPLDKGMASLADKEDMVMIALDGNTTDLEVHVGRDELQWMSQWSDEEELVSEQVLRNVRAPWQRSGLRAGAVALLIFVVLAGLARTKAKAAPRQDAFYMGDAKFV